MSTEQNKATVRRFIEMLDTNELAALDDVLSPELAQDWQGGISMDWVTDHHITVTDIVAEGDKVVVALATRGIHTGDLEGVPATGKSWTNQGSTFFRLENGKIVDMLVLFDSLNILKQIGVTITPA